MPLVFMLAWRGRPSPWTRRFAIGWRLAGLHHRALGDELAAMLDEAERGLFWERVSEGYTAVSGAQTAPYDAADEFPEYAELRAEPLPTPVGLADDMSGYAIGEASE